MANKYKYYSIIDGKRKDEYISYTDIASEHGCTKNSVAGKFYRAEREGSNRIIVNYTFIEREKIQSEVKNEKLHRNKTNRSSRI